MCLKKNSRRAVLAACARLSGETLFPQPCPFLSLKSFSSSILHYPLFVFKLSRLNPYAYAIMDTVNDNLVIQILQDTHMITFLSLPFFQHSGCNCSSIFRMKSDNYHLQARKQRFETFFIISLITKITLCKADLQLPSTSHYPHRDCTKTHLADHTYA
jgi:hypothetical protein